VTYRESSYLLPATELLIKLLGEAGRTSVVDQARNTIT
jgi:hypothetical protein